MEAERLARGPGHTGGALTLCGVDTIEDRERGRELYAAHAWQGAYESLSSADLKRRLEAPDLELLATAAYMLGREDEYVGALERAYHRLESSGDAQRAARCAFWVGLNLLQRSEPARANGWFGRAQRLLDRDALDCAERGYLLIPTLLLQVLERDDRAAHDTAAAAAAIGARHGDPDLVALTEQEQGHALIRLGRTDEGLRLIDETMLAVTTGRLSPIVTGLVYCNTIDFCQSTYELGRAREWTDALSRWCEHQPEMVTHTGACLVHRAEIMELAGAWDAALEEAQRALERLVVTTSSARDAGRAAYRQGELHRLRGEADRAEDAYAQASRHGWEPQPGFALLRLAQARGESGASAIGRLLGETTERFARLRLLPAQVELALALGEVDAADAAARELERIRESQQQSPVIEAISAGARGAVELARGEAAAALIPLRRSFELWQELEVPYESARARVLVGLACRGVGDHDTAALELAAARATFADLGAGPDLERVDRLDRSPQKAAGHGLTARELEVLRLVAAGQSNREIAAALVISEHTVARHLQNIYAKLGVSTRTAASAFAFEHDLV